MQLHLLQVSSSRSMRIHFPAFLLVAQVKWKQDPYRSCYLNQLCMVVTSSQEDYFCAELLHSIQMGPYQSLLLAYALAYLSGKPCHLRLEHLFQ